ncbi:hypothetical protein [Methanofollis ethanolicus]|uniref:hypothetical protein n=1 Tax=Methanofollis ethanolicus TaxID=488124 RepID=UPI00082E856F|nr:hypothetical protein [Methanofollis ethanolicus]
MAGTAYAATITASPDQIDEGGTVRISISDLQDGASFSLRIDAKFAVSPSSKFTYSTDNFVLPIALRDAETTVHTENAQTIEVAIKKGGTTKGMRGIADASGSITTTLLDNITAGTYDRISLTGTAMEGKNTIVTGVSLTGEKQGPNNSEISFTVNGIQDGTVTITALVDGAEKLRKVVTIGKGISPVETSSSSGSSGGDGGKAAATSTPSPTVASVDGTVRLTGTGTGGISILNVKAEKVPAEWQALTGVYTLTPAGTAFSPKAGLNFRIPAAADPETGTLFLARYDGGAWHQVPSRIDGDWIRAEIPAAGTYALMTFAPTATAQTPVMTATGSETTAAPSMTTVLSSTPVPPSTQKSGLSIYPALGVLISLLYLAGRQKRE